MSRIYGREWHLRLPWATPPASANDRDHWRVKAGKVATIRATVRTIAHDARVPTLGHVEVGLTYYPRDRRRRDPDNLTVPLFKACADGLVDAGVVPDDTPQWMTRLMPTIAEPDGDPRIVLHIREVHP